MSETPTTPQAVAQTDSAAPEIVTLDYAAILQALPHRFPFLFIDGVTRLERGVRIEGYKNVSFNDPFFSGHFPNDPVMPGVIQIEALAQAACILIARSFPEEAAGKRPAFAGIEEARFRRPVRPGDKLVLIVDLEKYRRGFAMLKARAEVNAEVVCEAAIKATMV
jgi:beta-hydroxyacyl-ACP dehydratase FabZ